MTATKDISFFADFQGLAALRKDAKAQAPDALEEAAKQFESLFTQMLLKSMREASNSFGDELFGSDQADLYQGMFDDQIALQLSKGKGLGLADMLIRQLAESGVASPLPFPPPPGGGGNGRSVSLPDFPPGGGGKGVPASQLDPPPPGRRGNDRSASLLDPPPLRGGGQGGGVPLASSKDDFIRSMWPHAEQTAREIGVDPHALLAQAALETGWGRSVPGNTQGECSFNLFGIKAGSRWSGATVSVPTLEFEEGIPVRKVERFRSYASAAESFRDYAALIRGNSRYESALGTGNDVASFAAALQEGGYATDPHYAQKIAAVAGEVRSRLQAGAFKFAAAAPLSDQGVP